MAVAASINLCIRVREFRLIAGQNPRTFVTALDAAPGDLQTMPAAGAGTVSSCMPAGKVDDTAGLVLAG